MCRNIKPLFNYEPPATDEEIRDAALQFVRKISGFHAPSEINKPAFDRSVDVFAKEIHTLLTHLSTTAEPKDREVEAAKAHERALKRFGAS